MLKFFTRIDRPGGRESPEDNSAGDMSVAAQPIPTMSDPAISGTRASVPREFARIGLVFARFSMASLLTAILDNAIFYALYRATGSIAGAQGGARIVAVLFNYQLVRRAVFLSGPRHRIALPRYLALAAANVVVSYTGIRLLSSLTPLSVFASKIVAETLLFMANFAIQRAFIFRRMHTRRTHVAHDAGL